MMKDFSRQTVSAVTVGLIAGILCLPLAHAKTRKPKASPSPSPSASPSPDLSPAPASSSNPTTSSFPAGPGIADLSVSPTSLPVELPDLTLDKDGGITLTLEDSIRLAIQGATSVLRAKNQVAITGAQLLQGYGQFLPNLTAQGNYSYSNGSVYYTQSVPTLVKGSGTGAGYELNADLNIFNGLADFSALKSSSLKKDAADLTLFRAEQQIALDITQSFLQVILDNKLVDIARKNLQESDAREKLLEEQTRVGIRNLSDLFRQEAQTSSDESLLLTSENKTRSDQIRFLIKLRADVAKKYHFVEPNIDAHSVEERFSHESDLLQIGLSNRTDLKASNDLSQAGHWDVKTNFAGYLPKLDIVGNITSGGRYLDDQAVNGADITPTYQPNLGTQLGNYVDYTIGLNLTWTIFDRFVTHQNVTHARAMADNLDIDAQDRRNQVEGDIRQAFGDYQTGIQQLRASKKGLDAAQKAYEVMEGRYEVGSASFIDLITVQAALVQAESARAQALIGFILNGAEVDFSTGETKVE